MQEFIKLIAEFHYISFIFGFLLHCSPEIFRQPMEAWGCHKGLPVGLEEISVVPNIVWVFDVSSEKSLKPVNDLRIFYLIEIDLWQIEVDMTIRSEEEKLQEINVADRQTLMNYMKFFGDITMSRSSLVEDQSLSSLNET